MKIRIIGCGSMGSAIAQTLSSNRQKVLLYDKHFQRAELLAAEIGADVLKEPLEGDDGSDFLVLAVKPQHFKEAAEELKEFMGPLVVSILSGLTTSQLKNAFPTQHVLRMMPNIAIRYGDGIVALAENPLLENMKAQIEEVFSSLGMLRWMPEDIFDGITSLTGSGPAFVMAMIEAMVDAAIAMGIDAKLGYELVKKMIENTLTILYESSDDLGTIEWNISSPKGTTIAGLRELEAQGVRSGIIETFIAAYERSKELSRIHPDG